MDLPVDIDTAKVNATLKDGILTLDLPKTAAAKAARIEPKEL